MNENDFFRPEKVEEQIDQLTQQVSEDPGELQSTHLIAALQHIYQQEEARESVARVKQRIERRKAKEEEMRDGRESGRIARPYDMNKRERMGGNKTRKIVGMPRLLSIIAAVLIVGVIVGSWIVVARMAANHVGRTPTSQNKHADNVYIGGKQIVYKLNGDTGAIMWQRKLSTGGAIQIKILGTVIYVVQNSDIYAFNGQDGSLRWHKQNMIGTNTTVIAQDSMLYLDRNYLPEEKHSNPLLIALNARDGSERWRNTMVDSYFGELTLQHGTLYVREAKVNKLDAIDAATGTLRWQVDENFSGAGRGYESTQPVVVSGIVYDAFINSIYALDEKTGRTIWHQQTSPHVRVSSPEFYKGIIYMNPWMYVFNSNEPITFQGQISALDARTGTVQWTSPAGYSLVENVPVSNGLLFATNHDKGMITFYALDAINGKVHWQYKESCIFAGSDCLAGAVIVKGIVYIFESKGVTKEAVLGFDIQIGKKLSQYDIRERYAYYIQGADDKIYFMKMTQDQPGKPDSTFTIRLDAYQLSKGVVRWQHTSKGLDVQYAEIYEPVPGQ